MNGIGRFVLAAVLVAGGCMRFGFDFDDVGVSADAPRDLVDDSPGADSSGPDRGADGTVDQARESAAHDDGPVAEGGLAEGGPALDSNKLPIGALCKAGGDCQSGHCVDAVCCESVCGGACMACSAAKTGQGDGDCAYISIWKNPDGECPSDQACDGAGSCKLLTGHDCAASNECISSYCVDDVCCEGPCSGVCMSCRANLTGNASGDCGFIIAGTDPYDECAGNATCDGYGGCNSLAVNGTPCSDGSVCLSGSCQDGYCCDATCSGLCVTCDKPGSEGSCSYLAVGTDPDKECPLGQACDGAGACGLLDGSLCAGDSECLSGFCRDAVCCNTDCSGLCLSCFGLETRHADGLCKAILAGADPNNECPGPSTCDGTGGCT